MGTNNEIIIDSEPCAAVRLPSPERSACDAAINEMCAMLDWFADSDDGFPFLFDGDLEDAIPAFK